MTIYRTKTIIIIRNQRNLDNTSFSYVFPFSGKTKLPKHYHKRRLALYSLYSFGVPALMTLGVGVLNNADGNCAYESVLVLLHQCPTLMYSAQSVELFTLELFLAFRLDYPNK